MQVNSLLDLSLFSSFVADDPWDLAYISEITCKNISNVLYRMFCFASARSYDVSLQLNKTS